MSILRCQRHLMISTFICLLLSTLSQSCLSFATNSYADQGTLNKSYHRHYNPHNPNQIQRQKKNHSKSIILKPSQETNEKIQRNILSLRAGAGAGLALGGGIDMFFRTFPYTAAFITCGIKASAADLVAQKKESNNKNKQMKVNTPSTLKSVGAAAVLPTKERGGGIGNYFQFRRNLAFILYGGLYQGMFQEFVYNNVFPILFGHSTKFRTVLSKVAFDLLVLTPFLCLPIAYMIKGFIFQKTPIMALRQYVGDVKNNGLLTKFWSLWCPVQFVTFGLIPEHFRITFIACISFFWLIILSAILEKSS